MLGDGMRRSDRRSRSRAVVDAATAAGSITLVSIGTSRLLARAGWSTLAEVRKELGLASHKGGMCVHVSVRPTSDFGKAVLLVVRVKSVKMSGKAWTKTERIRKRGEETYQIQISLEGTELFGSKVFRKDQ